MSAVELRRPRTEPPPTIRGYRQDEVVSALRKSIRRGLEDDALYWAVELDESGWGEYCFFRLFVILSEDIGLAEPLMPAVIAALYENWQALRKRRRRRSTGRATSQGAEKLPLDHLALFVDSVEGWLGELVKERDGQRKVREDQLDRKEAALAALDQTRDERMAQLEEVGITKVGMELIDLDAKREAQQQRVV